MGIDITTYQIRIRRFGPGRGYISTDIAEIYSSSTTGSDIHYKMQATMVILAFLLKCCVMIQQEGIMQDIYMFAGSCQSMAHLAIYINLLQEPYVLNRYTYKYFQIFTFSMHLLKSPIVN